MNLIDQPGDKSWPIVSATFIELPKDPKDAARSAAVMKFFDWAYKNGDEHRQRPGVHPAARPGEGRGSRRLARGGEGTGRQARHVEPCASRHSPLAAHGRRINRLQQAIASTAIAARDASSRSATRSSPFLARFAGAFVLVLLGAIIVSLFLGGFAGVPPVRPGFLVSADWDPVKEVFGAAVPIYGTIVTSILALLLAVPLAFGIAFYLTELAPTWLRRPVGTAVELLAAVPSIIYGMWGFFVIVAASWPNTSSPSSSIRSTASRCWRTCSPARRSAPASSPPR